MTTEPTETETTPIKTACGGMTCECAQQRCDFWGNPIDCQDADILCGRVSTPGGTEPIDTTTGPALPATTSSTPTTTMPKASTTRQKDTTSTPKGSTVTTGTTPDLPTSTSSMETTVTTGMCVKPEKSAWELAHPCQQIGLYGLAAYWEWNETHCTWLCCGLGSPYDDKRCGDVGQTSTTSSETTSPNMTTDPKETTCGTECECYELACDKGDEMSCIMFEQKCGVSTTPPPETTTPPEQCCLVTI